MRHSIIAGIAMLFILAFTSCRDEFDCPKGQGPTVSRTLAVLPFTGIALNGSHQVYVKKGGIQEVRVEGQNNIIDRIDLHVNNGRWTIQIRECVRRHDKLTFYITVPDVNTFIVNGSGAIVVEDLFVVNEAQVHVNGSGSVTARLEGGQVSSEITGSGDINLTGSADHAIFRIEGSGKHHAFGFPVKTSSVNISGSGTANVNVIETLDVRIAGSGEVNYKGQPNVTTSISGSGKVRPAN
jgi:hypothetical protein